MNPEIKAKWVAALRSGDYEQGSGRLRDDRGMCCLGVLCDLHSHETGAAAWSDGETGWDYATEKYTLPKSVIQWAGLATANPRIDPADELSALANYNDGAAQKPQTRFPEIADLIEKHL